MCRDRRAASRGSPPSTTSPWHAVGILKLRRHDHHRQRLRRAEGSSGQNAVSNPNGSPAATIAGQIDLSTLFSGALPGAAIRQVSLYQCVTFTQLARLSKNLQPDRIFWREQLLSPAGSGERLRRGRSGTHRGPGTIHAWSNCSCSRAIDNRQQPAPGEQQRG